MNFLRDLFTDAKSRAEIKLVLGAPIIVAATVYGLATRDWSGFGALSALGLGLIGGTAYADHRIDKGDK